MRQRERERYRDAWAVLLYFLLCVFKRNFHIVSVPSQEVCFIYFFIVKRKGLYYSFIKSFGFSCLFFS